MKVSVKLCCSYLAYHVCDFLCHLAYGSMHCVAILLSNLNDNIETGYLAFLLYYAYLPFFQWCFSEVFGFSITVSPTHVKYQNVCYFYLANVVFYLYLHFVHAIVRLFTVDPIFIIKYKQFLFFWEIKISDQIIEMKRNNYQKRLTQIANLPIQIIPEIINFIRVQGIKSKLHLKTFIGNDIFPWRCKINPNTGEISSVREGYQAHTLGVKSGWKIKRVTGRGIKLHYGQIAKQISFTCRSCCTDGKKCEIIFEEPLSHFIRLPLEVVAPVLFGILFALLFKLMHDVLYYIIFKQCFFIYFVNPAWEQKMQYFTLGQFMVEIVEFIVEEICRFLSIIFEELIFDTYNKIC